MKGEGGQIFSERTEMEHGILLHFEVW